MQSETLINNIYTYIYMTALAKYDFEPGLAPQPAGLAPELQCLICLQGPTINDEIKLINDMYFIKKPCNCLCYSHHKCIEKWLEIKAACPICTQPIVFPETNINPPADETTILINHNIPVRNYILNQPTSNCFTTLAMYMCMSFVIFSILLIGNLINIEL